MCASALYPHHQDGFSYDRYTSDGKCGKSSADEAEAHEAMLMRRIAGLIYVDDRDSGAQIAGPRPSEADNRRGRPDKNSWSES